MFQHTAARRRLANVPMIFGRPSTFQHTAARRRLGYKHPKILCGFYIDVSTHSRPKAAGICFRISPFEPTGFNTQPPEGGWFFGKQLSRDGLRVSTHSRPKAAGAAVEAYIGRKLFQHTAARRRLGRRLRYSMSTNGFNTQPPEGGWMTRHQSSDVLLVSTHSRPKAAGRSSVNGQDGTSRFNTQPPEGGWIFAFGAPIA